MYICIYIYAYRSICVFFIRYMVYGPRLRFSWSSRKKKASWLAGSGFPAPLSQKNAQTWMFLYIYIYISEFTELAKSRFLDCESCGMTQGALIRNVADCQALYMQAKQTRSDILYMTTLDTGRCSHSTCSLVVLIALYLTIPMAASRSTDSS